MNLLTLPTGDHIATAGKKHSLDTVGIGLFDNVTL